MKKKILLIEDDLPTVDIYETVLKRENFEVETVQTGLAGMKKIQEIKEGKIEKPDLILLDLILPDMNGIEILREARRCEKTKTIPFLILTNYADPELEKIGKELKVEGYFLKTDYTPRKLADIVKEKLKS